MKFKKPFTTVSMFLISSMLLFTSCRHHHKGEFALDYFSEALDLSTEQEEDLNNIRLEIMASVETMKEERKEAYQTLKAEIAKDQIDKAVVQQVIDEHHLRKEEIVDLALDKIITFHATLSPEQKEKLINKLEKFEKRHASHFHH